MGKAQKKTGKGRLDKYYKLAKEQGYRARSAFKLIQLNKKYAFLENARCTIDLCAAPGGWLQVASKYMPVNSVIVGVDLVPIKPIPRVVTFAADITTPKCRTLIRSELKDWKADVVLHDGAPNVGTAWIQDAYTQSELVLMSLKLAVEFLTKGGTFVTKVFRSTDYNNLIWVFNQLFGKVEATKPPSSRNVSAEIFVVCRDFLAPKHIDPKFLDPRHVFKEISSIITTQTEEGTSIAPNAQANVFQPEKKRRHRDGYADGDYTLFHTINAADFIRSMDPVTLLGSGNKISFITDEEKGWLKLPLTSADVKANCDDLKVLGKGDFKTLIRWRLALRQELGLDNKVTETEDLVEVAEVEEQVDEEQQITEELERLNSEAAARAKRDRRKANEIRTRTIQRMQLQMTAPLDIGLEQADMSLGGQDDIFTLDDSNVKRVAKSRRAFETSTMEDAMAESDSDGAEGEVDEDDEILNSDEERERRAEALEAEMDGLYDAYQERLRERDAKFKAKQAREKNPEREEWHGIGYKDDDDDSSDGEGGWRDGVDDNSFDDTSDEGDEDEEEEVPHVGKKRRLPPTGDTPKTKRSRTDGHKTAAQAVSQAAKVWFSQDVFAGVDGLDDAGQSDEDEDVSESDPETDIDMEEYETDEDDFEIVPQDAEADVDMWDVDDEDKNAVKRAKLKALSLDTPEAVTLAQQLVNRQTTKTHLINEGFNRYSLNAKDGLPSWFLDDESKHYKPNIPVTKEAMAVLRQKQRALDARPIKKVAEAKARKKFKAHQQLEKALKKAEGVNSTADMSEREKAQQIEKLMSKGRSKAKQKKKEISVVVAKGSHKGIQGRPKGVKGRYVMVDARMRKEVRAKKRAEKANKKRRKA